MPIYMNSLCVQCMLGKRLPQARSLGDDQTATRFTRQLMQEYLNHPQGIDSTHLGHLADKMMEEIYGLDPDRLKAEKEASNRFVLDRLPQIYARIRAAEDPVYAALQFAVLGNYLDFSALQGEVSFDRLDEMLDSALEMELDRDCYRAFLQDLREGKDFLYITDNAGEIAFDRVLAEELLRAYPHLNITFCVRGGPVSNDATRADAEAVGIRLPVIDNGTSIGGTVIPLIGQEAKEAMEKADVILAKGMGNTESMFGCGYNVYYAFLVKCDRFIQYFGKEKLTPMLVRDRKET